MRNQLERAREAVAAYHEYRGYPKDAEAIRSGTCDYSTDVQCALIAIIGCEDGIKPPQAAVRAYFLPSGCQSLSIPLGSQQ